MHIKGKVFFITGFEKNCGKTTFLNYLLSQYPAGKNIVCASVGITNDRDVFSDLQKPQVYVKKGWRILTNSLFLRYIDVPFIIEDVIDEDIGGGKPVLIKVLYDCSVKLFSPGSNSKIFDIIGKLLSFSDAVFIDGSFDRITQIASTRYADFYYVVKVDPGNINNVVEKIKCLENFKNILISHSNYDFMETIDKDVVFNDMLFVKGAFTYSKVETIPQVVKKIFIRDFTKVFIDYYDWLKIIEKYKVFFTASYGLVGYVINLYDISRDEFEGMFDRKTVKCFIYNPYEC